MYGLQQTTFPTTTVVDLATLKQHIRLNTSDEDGVLGLYLNSAQEMAERTTNRKFFSTQYQLYMDAWPKIIRLPVAPLISVESVRYAASDNTWVTFDSTKYSVDNKREPGRIVPTAIFPPAWGLLSAFPALSIRISPKIEVNFTAGYTSNIPPLLKQAVLLIAAHFWECRSDPNEQKVEMLPMGFRNILAQYRMGWLSNMNEPAFGRFAVGVE